MTTSKSRPDTCGFSENTLPPGTRIRSLTIASEKEIAGLCDVLIDCVEDGASVSFMWPMTRAKADAFWRRTVDAVARGERNLLIAEDDAGTILGTVTLILNLPENQPHRADVAKMLVHRNARRRGIAAALLCAAEARAAAAGRRTLVLDTVTGSDAERLYARGGWQRCGVIPEYALFPDGRTCATTVFYKVLDDGTAARGLVIPD